MPHHWTTQTNCQINSPGIYDDSDEENIDYYDDSDEENIDYNSDCELAHAVALSLRTDF